MQDPSIAPIYLSIATVLYKNQAGQLERFRDQLLQSIDYACGYLPIAKVSVAIVDNAAHEDGERFRSIFARLPGVDSKRLLCPDENLGYGRAHNLCMHQGGDFHLILNPDVYLAEDAIFQGLQHLLSDKHCVLVAPTGVDQQQQPLFLAKRFPSVLDLALRGFAPQFIKQVFNKRLSHYQYTEQQTQTAPYPIQIASGCCMLVRTDAIQRIGGFDPAFFLYFEDFDLSLRLAKQGQLHCVPQMKIVHDGGNTARKGLWHIRQFIDSAKLFFNKHGWRWH